MAPGVDIASPDKATQEKERALLEKYTRVLESFLVTIDAQVTAVHSLQVFCLSHNFPKGLLLRWFLALYELSIIDEEAFIKWKEDVTDAYPGKGKALFQVSFSFFFLLIYFLIFIFILKSNLYFISISTINR